MTEQIGIRCALMRGGTSKGAYFLASDLPDDPAARDRILLAALGSPDPRQIDGIGGAHPLTSKVAVVSKSDRPNCDVDYLFLQIVPDKPIVSDKQNCGNILAGVAPFAIERGLMQPAGERTTVRVYMVNSDSKAEVTVETPGGRVRYDGDVAIDGVPGTHAPVTQAFLDTEGSACGALLPTGRTKDEIDGVPCTLIDNGMPVVVLPASALGLTGYEDADALEGDAVLKERLERIRLAAGPLMGLGDVRAQTVPKLTLVAPPRDGGMICTRTFTPFSLHASIGVLGAVTVATACLLDGSPAHALAAVPSGPSKLCDVEHPSGRLTVALEIDPLAIDGGAADLKLRRAALVRTARLLMDGTVFVAVAR
ncbi:4-oxalomesaconate tautomerase [Azospirillum sp. TSH7]|uniref:4-oxalomesaconate tautomerase n=1 Tax=unclassified Azospirillum TaxID=2630922 RepID=UPI000D609DE2|nr:MULTISPECIES: 4-oxalomesaconate tautomerase [unclassified Azospirillum]PWC66333.1 4-oxalomesaconate tautomerase [Azospirillum sp. TSH7]PWC70094.1 4-oxalomesaconate tautomerase [Azospirillum sp. TSH20]